MLSSPKLLVVFAANFLLVGSHAGVISECSAGSCADCLDAATSGSLEKLISASAVVLIAIPNMRCTLSAQRKLQSCGIRATEHFFTPADIGTSWSNFQTEDAQWKYMDCRYHTEQGGMTMHSWIFLNGELLGDGFDIMELPCATLTAIAETTSGADARAEL